MSENKKIVEKYIDGFEKSDHEQILSCLNEDVIWYIPGMFKKEAKRNLMMKLRMKISLAAPQFKLKE